MADKELTAAEKRESLIRSKMLAGGMTRECAEMVLDHQEAEDARQEKKKAKSKKEEKEPAAK